MVDFTTVAGYTVCCKNAEHGFSDPAYGCSHYFREIQEAGIVCFPERVFKTICCCHLYNGYFIYYRSLNFTTGLVSVMNIVYGSIFTPVYEELLFRGYIWNRFKDVTGSETGIYVWNIVLFAIWHIGYMVPNIISGNWFAVITKVAAGAVYGAILGFIRIKTRNCWSTILVHGVLNLVVI